PAAGLAVVLVRRRVQVQPLLVGDFLDLEDLHTTLGFAEGIATKNIKSHKKKQGKEERTHPLAVEARFYSFFVPFCVFCGYSSFKWPRDHVRRCGCGYSLPAAE